MKMRSPHIVPLARQAMAILEELKAVTGHFPYVFPNVRSRFRPRATVRSSPPFGAWAIGARR
jgi:integrase